MNKWIEIENWAKDFWSKIKTNPLDLTRSPYYLLEMFPYPSGSNLHMGHMLGYISADIYSRFKQMQGDNVLRVMGFDSFGLPAEQYAIQTGQHPKDTTAKNIANMEQQLRSFSMNYDWTRTIHTSDPEYYKWTQWIMLQLYDSFFDPNEIWTDHFGSQVVGKAKPIALLYEYIKSGEWAIYQDTEGGVFPAINNTDLGRIDVDIEKGEVDSHILTKAIDNARLAYLADEYVNWCPGLGTVLANEEVTSDGKSERGNYQVERRKMKQWVLRITEYADRLATGFDKLNWPQQTVDMQVSWIGKSIGMEFVFDIVGTDQKLAVFTTRPDTILGVTALIVGPNHPLAVPLEGETGRFTGHFARIDILTEPVPIWTGDYVIDDYGNGAVMGVPAHDHRDFAFAKKYGLSIKPAIIPDEGWLNAINLTLNEWIANPEQPFTNAGPVICKLVDGRVRYQALTADDELTYVDSAKFIGELTGSCRIKKCYKLRDWLFSRQRYWGEPFPIVYDDNGKVYPLDESELPVELPDTINFQPDTQAEQPQGPLVRCTSWVNVTGQIKNGKVVTKNIDGPVQNFRRETNTMPNWAGSCWYYLRYMDPHNQHKMLGDDGQYWCNNKYATVDLYIGGSEHAVLHLLYARFWHMFLFDRGFIPNPEPFQRLIHQGMVTADAFTDQNGHYVDVNQVILSHNNGKKTAKHSITGEELTIVYGKMGKSYKNGVLPSDISEKYGVDIFRLHLMYMGPITQSREWNLDGIAGMERFCQKMYNLSEKLALTSSQRVTVALQKTIQLVTKQYDTLHYNTAIASLIKFTNEIDSIAHTEYVALLILLAPCAPHFCEYMYNKIGCEGSVFERKWPEYDQAVLDLELVKVPVMKNSKLRFVLEVSHDISDEELRDQIKSRLPLEHDLHIKVIRRGSKPVTCLLGNDQ
jgi:leucyl-tRNA synthetase